MNISSSHRTLLVGIARRLMAEQGLAADFAAPVLEEVRGLAAAGAAAGARDLRAALWSSIDNDDSRDLDQLTTAEAQPDGSTRVMVAVADVDSLVPDGSQTDRHARHNTTSVYTPGAIFPMLPEGLSTDLTSLNLDVDRAAIVIDMAVAPDGSLAGSDVFPALVRNQAKLSYGSVSAWLDGQGPAPGGVSAVAGMAGQIHVQDEASRRLQERRRQAGALDLETSEARAVLVDDRVELVASRKNRARLLIENFMIAANGAVARFLESRGCPSIRRVVRSPRRWDRIVALAREAGHSLPDEPDARALARFLAARKAVDPIRFPDLSLAVVKLLGPGEYALEHGAADETGDGPAGSGGRDHFGLAARDYAHSTAPNRRYPDLVVQRLLKAALAARRSPYTTDELNALARHCTLQEDKVNKVERQAHKAAAALLLESRLGDTFEAIVTGASSKGTWVRVLDPPVEGRLVQGFQGVDVGDHLRVSLVETDPERGFIDFARA